MASESSTVGRRHSKRVRVIGYAWLAVFTLIVIELGVRALYWVWDSGVSHLAVEHLGLANHLNAYEMRDPDNPSNWLLRAGTEWRLSDLWAEKDQRGAALGLAHLRRIEAQHGLAPDEIVMRINQHGFKGPELRPLGQRLRVLALGDYCTFGSMLDRDAYPRVMERTFGVRPYAVEMINAGVEGYTIHNLRYRMPDYLSLKPDLVTFYIGWNSLYSNRLINQGYVLRTVALLDTARQWLDARAAQRDAIAVADLSAAERERLRSVELPFLAALRDTADAFAHQGSHVVILTLPGLFLPDQAPSQEALAKGHLPRYTDNPYVLAVLTAHYNQALRQLAMSQGWTLVDLDAWSRTALVPRHQFFADSVHLTSEGQALLGQYLADQLQPILAQRAHDREGTE